MSVKVDRKLVFKGSAADGDNIEGNPSCSKLVFCDDFTQATLDATNDYTVTVGGTNDAVAIDATPGSGGWISILSGDTDDQTCMIATPLIFDATKNPVIECRMYFSKITETAFFFGFSDAVTEGTPAMTIDYAGGTLAAAATDAAGFVSDADKESSLFYAASIATGGSVAAATTGVTPVNSTLYVLRIAIDSNLDAYYWINGVLKNVVQSAVTDVPLCAIFNTGTRANGGGDEVYVDYLKYWQDR